MTLKRAIGIAIVACLLSAQTPPADPAPPPPGKLVDIGGWRLHLNCMGQNKQGSPTVVLEAGAGGSSLDWALVQPEVAKFTRACAYDRAGTAWSELGPRPRTFRQNEYELHALLGKAGIPGPYVVVGHSIGGLLIRNFHWQFPKDVAGMVFVDPTSDDTRLVHNAKLMRLREDTTGKPIPPARTTILPPEKQLSAEERKMADEMMRQGPPPPRIDPSSKYSMEVQRWRIWTARQPERTVDGSIFTGQEFAELYQARQGKDHVLGDLPIIVLIARQREQLPDTPRFHDWIVPNEEINRQDEEIARFSTRGKFIYAEHSGHGIPYDEPEVVASAIREVVSAATRK